MSTLSISKKRSFTGIQYSFPYKYVNNDISDLLLRNSRYSLTEQMLLGVESYKISLLKQFFTKIGCSGRLLLSFLLLMWASFVISCLKWCDDFLSILNMSLFSLRVIYAINLSSCCCWQCLSYVVFVIWQSTLFVIL